MQNALRKPPRQEAPVMNALTGALTYPRPSEDEEWMAGMREQAGLHRPYTAPGAAPTTLSPAEEGAFRRWLGENQVRFNPDDPIADYDMRGYWRDVAAKGDSQTAVNRNDHQLHFPDTYKTPYHRSFSAESRFATPQAPSWTEDDRLIRPDGQVVFDERARR